MRAGNVEVLGASKAEIMQQWSSVLPGGRFLCQDGVCAVVTGVPAPALDAADSAASAAGAVPRPDGLTIERLAPQRASRHAAVAAAGFGTARDIFQRLVTPDLLRLASVPSFRGRGFGAAVTARAVADGLAAGSAWCWLEASTTGRSVYQKLGFQVIEPRRGWASAS